MGGGVRGEEGGMGDEGGRGGGVRGGVRGGGWNEGREGGRNAPFRCSKMVKGRPFAQGRGVTAALPCQNGLLTAVRCGRCVLIAPRG